MKDSINLSCENYLATITFNRPDKLNTFNRAMADRFEELCQEVNENSNIRMVLFKGAGEAFMAGADLYELHRDLDTISAEALSIIRQFNSSILLLREMEKLVVASVHGLVMGIGMSLMLAADLVISSDNTKFSLGYNQIALTPAGASTYLLPRIVGTRKALELILMPEVIDANTAKTQGLINWLVPHDELTTQTERLINQIIDGPIIALVKSKQLINSSWQNKLTTQLELEAEALTKCVGTKDFKNAVRAFVNKRVPEFEGR